MGTTPGPDPQLILFKDNHTSDPKMGQSQGPSQPLLPQLGEERQLEEAGTALHVPALLGFLTKGRPGLQGELPDRAEEITDHVPSGCL